MPFCLNKIICSRFTRSASVGSVYSAEAGTHLAQRQQLIGDYNFIEFISYRFVDTAFCSILYHYKSTFHIGSETDVFRVLMLRCWLSIISTRGATSVGEIIMFGATTVRKFKPICLFNMTWKTKTAENNYWRSFAWINIQKVSVVSAQSSTMFTLPKPAPI